MCLAALLEKKLPNLLAFDTSTELMAIGLMIDGRTWLREQAGGATASAELLPAVVALLERAGSNLSDLHAIAFGQGPGAFTGLRTACSVAQGLGFGAGKPLIAVDSLLVVAEAARSGADLMDVWSVMDARMGEVYFAHYRFAAGAWATIRAPELAAPKTLNEIWLESPPQHAAGSALNAFVDQLGVGAAVHHAEVRPRAEALLTLAASAWAEGRTIDAEEALPVYVRNKVARTTAERALEPNRSAASGAADPT